MRSTVLPVDPDHADRVDAGLRDVQRNLRPGSSASPTGCTPFNVRSWPRSSDKPMRPRSAYVLGSSIEMLSLLPLRHVDRIGAGDDGVRVAAAVGVDALVPMRRPAVRSSRSARRCGVCGLLTSNT